MRSLMLLAAVSLLIPSSQADADVGKDDSTRVTAKVKLAENLASFKGLTLELRLYEYDPLLADAGANLVEKKVIKDFAHTQGKATNETVVIGAKGKLKPRRNYYLTTFVLDGGKRTHMGEKDGKRGLCKVISNGQPRTVNVIVRDLRK